MGAICGSNKKSIPNLSLSGKRVDSCNSLKARVMLYEDEFPVYKTAESVLYYALNREIMKIQQEDSNNDNILMQKSNEEFQFLDVRDKQDYIEKGHFLTSLYADPDDNDELWSKQSTLKIMFNFKQIFFIHGEEVNGESENKQIPEKVQKILKIFKEQNIKVSNVNIMADSYEKISKKFPYFVAKKEEQGKPVVKLDQFSNKKSLPILLFSNDEFIQEIYDNQSEKKQQKLKKKAANKVLPEQKWQVFLHTLQRCNQIMETDQDYYKNHLGIDCVIFANKKQVFIPEKIYGKPLIYSIDQKSADFKDNCIKLMNQLWSNLQNNKQTLIIHDSGVQGSGLHSINIIKSLLYEKLYIFESHIEEYITTRVSRNINKKMSLVQAPRAQLKKTMLKDPKNDNFSDQVKIEFENLYKETKKKMPVVEKVKTMMIGMMDKIVQNENDDKFRNIKKNNKAMQENIFKYKSGLKLMDMIGFSDNKEEMYVNTLEARYIKLIKGDIELGYTNFKFDNNLN